MDDTMKRVTIESPYRGNVDRNLAYLKFCMRDCINKGENPFAGHLFFTSVLDDNKEEDRKLGISLHLNWLKICDKVVVYEDYGISEGMFIGITCALENEKEIEYRKLDVMSCYDCKNVCLWKDSGIDYCKLLDHYEYIDRIAYDYKSRYVCELKSKGCKYFEKESNLKKVSCKYCKNINKRNECLFNNFMEKNFVCSDFVDHTYINNIKNVNCRDCIYFEFPVSHEGMIFYDEPFCLWDNGCFDECGKSIDCKDYKEKS